MNSMITKEKISEYGIKAKHVQELIADAYKEGQEEHRNLVSVQLLELPEQIKQQSLVIANTSADVEMFRRVIDSQKNQALELVLCATEDGKPKYSNDKARNIAVNQLLKDDRIYFNALDEFNRNEVELRREQIQLDYLQNQFRAYLAIAGMQAAKL